MHTYGIDVSHWEGDIDWNVVRTDGMVKFAILKATEGTGHIDSRYYANKAGCQSVHMPWGAYHFFRPNLDAEQQAEHFKNTVGSGCYVYVIDVEVSGLGLVQKIQQFLDALDVDTKMIYTGPAFWNTHIGDQEWAAEYDLWIANYEVEHPWVPKPWEEYKIWQFSDRGTNPGIPALAVDEDYFNGDIQMVVDFFKNGNEGPEPPPSPDKVKVNVHSLNIRNSPIVNPSTQIGITTYGKVWEVEATSIDCNGRVWYRVGKAAYLAGWLCVAV